MPPIQPIARFALNCVTLFVIGLAVSACFRADRAELEMDAAWTTDAPAALARAAAESKVVLLDFTGSDWCDPCKLLNREVFSQSEFKSYAEKNLVLVKIDFPKRRGQTDAEKRQNQALMEQYQVEGFPTIIVLDPSGKKVGELTYIEGGVGPWLAELRKITKS